jgi:hypothetical protein
MLTRPSCVRTAQRTDSLEFRVEFVVQSYLNFVFVDPPADFDPQARGAACGAHTACKASCSRVAKVLRTAYVHFLLWQYDLDSFLLRKKSRRLLRDAAPGNATAAATAPLSAQFPFGQAECVHSCLADDYRFTQRHNAHAGGATAAARAAEGAFTVPMLDVLLAGGNEAGVSDDASASASASAQEKEVLHSRGRAALDIGPFTFPNLQSKRDKLDAAAMQIRTTIQNFLNLRLRNTVTPFVAASAVARFGTQVTQRLSGKPVDVRACYCCCALLCACAAAHAMLCVLMTIARVSCPPQIQFYGRFGVEHSAGIRKVINFQVLGPNDRGFISLGGITPGFFFGSATAFTAIINRVANATAAARAAASSAAAAVQSALLSPPPLPAPPLPPPVPPPPPPPPPTPPPESPLNAGRRKMLQAELSEASRLLSPPDLFGVSVVAPLLFPASLVDQARARALSLRIVASLGLASDARARACLCFQPRSGAPSSSTGASCSASATFLTRASSTQRLRHAC